MRFPVGVPCVSIRFTMQAACTRRFVLRIPPVPQVFRVGSEKKSARKKTHVDIVHFDFSNDRTVLAAPACLHCCCVGTDVSGRLCRLPFGLREKRKRMNEEEVDGARSFPASLKAFVSHPAVLAHTFVLERVLRALVPGVPRDATLCSYLHPLSQHLYPPLEGAELAAYDSLLRTRHRKFEDFEEAWVRLGFAGTAYPAKLCGSEKDKAKALQRKQYMRAMYQWNAFLCSPALEVRYIDRGIGFGVFVRDRVDVSLLGDVAGVAALRGTTVLVSRAAVKHRFLQER